MSHVMRVTCDGKYMSTVHEPVLIKEVLAQLQPRPGQNFIDGTIGGGGHAEKILDRTGPDGRLLGLDWDAAALKRTKERLKKYSKRLVLEDSSYINIKKLAYDRGFYKVNGVLLDLGLSSDQLQNSGRGFSFQVNEPLDMRFSLENELTAAMIVNSWPAEKLENILREYADERWARKISLAIAAKRLVTPIKTTMELVGLLIKVLPRAKSRIHPATKTFQALRMAVNNEISNVKIAIKDIVEMLEPGARLAVITFHSVEDRAVKHFFKEQSRDCLCPPEIPECRCGHKAQIKLITTKPIVPTDEEISQNFRSRSAKLRVVEKI